MLKVLREKPKGVISFEDALKQGKVFGIWHEDSEDKTLAVRGADGEFFFADRTAFNLSVNETVEGFDTPQSIFDWYGDSNQWRAFDTLAEAAQWLEQEEG